MQRSRSFSSPAHPLRYPTGRRPTAESTDDCAVHTLRICSLMHRRAATMLEPMDTVRALPQLTQAQTSADIEVSRELLREYQKALGVDLCFQGFEDELLRLPGAYAPPTGRLLVASNDGGPVGCVALQQVDSSRGEMKRLYVRPSARGTGLGRILVTRILDDARSIGYREVVLDTLPTMVEAQKLYEQFGFQEIEPYRPNPIVGSRYMGKKL